MISNMINRGFMWSWRYSELYYPGTSGIIERIEEKSQRRPYTQRYRLRVLVAQTAILFFRGSAARILKMFPEFILEPKGDPSATYCAKCAIGLEPDLYPVKMKGAAVE